MKILFTIDTLAGGGTETSILELVKQLGKKNNITILYFYADHTLLSAFEQSPCQVIYFNLSGKYSFISGITRLSKLLQKEKFQVVVTSLYRSSIISRIAGLITHTPVVDTIVSDSYGEAKKKEFKGIHILKHLSVYWLDKLTSFIPKLWISNSVNSAEPMGSKLGIDKNNIKVIYRGRNVSSIEEWKPPPYFQPFRFIAVGRLCPAKDYKTLIEAFYILKKTIPKIELTIYGEGMLRHELEQLLVDFELTDHVFLPGRIDQPYTQFANQHCYILSSVLEGFSGALIESMLTSIPIIASNIPMNLEAVENKKTGTVHKKTDPDDLASRMKWVMENYSFACDMGKNARKLAIEKYDLRKICVAYEQALFQIVKYN